MPLIHLVHCHAAAAFLREARDEFLRQSFGRHRSPRLGKRGKGEGQRDHPRVGPHQDGERSFLFPKVLAAIIVQGNDGHIESVERPAEMGIGVLAKKVGDLRGEHARANRDCKNSGHPALSILDLPGAGSACEDPLQQGQFPGTPQCLLRRGSPKE